MSCGSSVSSEKLLRLWYYSPLMPGPRETALRAPGVLCDQDAQLFRSSIVRCSAMRVLSGSISIPIHSRPRRRATEVVVPLPTNGSSTVPAGGENKRITRRANSSGNSASCRSLRDTEGMDHTPARPPLRPFPGIQAFAVVLYNPRTPKNIDVLKLVYRPVGIRVPAAVRPTRILVPDAPIVQVEACIRCPLAYHMACQ